MATRTLFITAQFLIENSFVDNNAEQKILNTCIRVASDKYLMPIIGSNLYAKIINEISANTLSGTYKTLHDENIIPCLIWYSLLEYSTFNTFKFRNKGISKQTSETSEPVDLDELVYTTNQLRDTAQFYGQQLIKYLEANINTFPEYLRYTSIADTPPARSEYFSGIQFPGSNRGSDCGTFGLGLDTPVNW